MGQPIDSAGIPAGTHHTTGEGRHQVGELGGPKDRRRTDESAKTGQRSAPSGDRYRHRYGQPAGQQTRTGEADADRVSAESSGGARGEQPRDPETGRFLPKGQAEPEE